MCGHRLNQQDPFNMKPYEGPPGTKDKPLEVLSMFDERIIGCICECLTF